jgi:hypothetical protein
MMHRINRRAPFHHDHFAADCLMMHWCTRRRPSWHAPAGALIGLLIRPGNGGAEAAHAGI